MEELRNEEMELNNENEMAEAAMDEETKSSGGGLIGLAIGLGSLVVGGIALYKNKDKIKEKRIEKQIAKLNKKGFVVTKPEDVVAEEVEEELPEETEEN